MARVEEPEWPAVLDRLREGDSLALVQLTRRVNTLLGRWSAFDFRDDWDDVVQEVIFAAVRAYEQGRIHEQREIAGYLHNTARFQFIDRIRAKSKMSRQEPKAWEEESADLALPAQDTGDAELAHDLEWALAHLPEARRQAVVAVYVEGRTYDEACIALGARLGTLKRDLKLGLLQLKGILESRGAKNRYPKSLVSTTNPVGSPSPAPAGRPPR